MIELLQSVQWYTQPLVEVYLSSLAALGMAWSHFPSPRKALPMGVWRRRGHDLMCWVRAFYWKACMECLRYHLTFALETVSWHAVCAYDIYGIGKLIDWILIGCCGV